MNDSYLMHYGVLGMKWGVRKANNIKKAEHGVISASYEKKMRDMGYSEDAIKRVRKKLKERLKNAKNKNKMESRQRMKLSKLDPTITKEDFVNEYLKKAKFQDYQKLKKDFNERNSRRYKENLALYGAGLVAPGPIVSDLIGLGAAIANDIRSQKSRTIEKANLDSAKSTAINSLANKITKDDIDKLLKHNERGFNMKDTTFSDLRELGYDVLAHHGIDGQKWGVRNGPPYPLDAEGKKSFRERLKERRKQKKRQKILNDPKKLKKHINEFSTEEIEEATSKQQALNDYEYSKGWKRKQPAKLSKKQKEMANSAGALLANMDKFSADEFESAMDRLHKREELKDILVGKAKRFSDLTYVGSSVVYNLVNSLKSGMTMSDMYKTMFGGATYDEKHAAWLVNNKEPVSGSMWAHVIGESRYNTSGKKFEDQNKLKIAYTTTQLKNYANNFNNERQRQFHREENQKNRDDANQRWAVETAQKRADNRYEFDEKNKTNRYEIRKEWDTYKQLGKIPNKNITAKTVIVK